MTVFYAVVGGFGIFFAAIGLFVLVGLTEDLWDRSRKEKDGRRTDPTC